MGRLRLWLPRARHLPRLAALTLLALVLLSTYTILGAHTASQLVPYTPPPHALQLGHPTFEEVREYERMLPQHRAVSVFEKRPRYLFFPWEAWGTGWNNVFQEQLLNTHLAYLANRGYVFVDYIARDHPPFPDTLPNGTRHMLHIPMTAFTVGPTGGGAWGPRGGPITGSHVSRGVSQRYWDLACPPSKIIEVPLRETMAELNITDETSGEERLLRWAAKLGAMEAECVQVVGGTPFDFVFMNLPARVLSLWPSYGASPTLAEFAWSPLVTRALWRNRGVFLSRSASSLASFSPNSASSNSHDDAASSPKSDDDDIPHALLPLSPSRINAHSNAAPDAHSNVKFAPLRFDDFAPLRISTPTPPFPRLLALHVRRGDFEAHCTLLAERGMGFNAWAALGDPRLQRVGEMNPKGEGNSTGHGEATEETQGWPSLPDYLSVPQGMSRQDAALGHCWPDVEAVLEKVRAVRAEYLASSHKSSPHHSPSSPPLDSSPPPSHDPHAEPAPEAQERKWRRLDTIYIATNAERGWVDGLSARLRGEGWRVGSSLDMWASNEFTKGDKMTKAEREREREDGERQRPSEERERERAHRTSEEREREEKEVKEELAVAQAVDMGVLVGAEVFIGQGFSSLTSNVVQLRLAGGRAPGTIRFW